MESHEIKIHNYKEKEIKNALAILSFPTVGMISNITANYIIQNLQLELIGAFLSPKLPATAIIQNEIPMPAVRIYAGKHVCGSDGECDQIVVITTDLPIDPTLLDPLADAIIEWCKSKNIEIITTIEGINKEEPLFEDPKVYSISSNDAARKQVEKVDAEALKVGMVSGISGVLLYKGHIIDYPISSILAEAHRDYPDSRSAAAVLQAINVMLPEIDMDPSPLIEQAEIIEFQIKQGLSQIQQGEAQSQGVRGYFA